MPSLLRFSVSCSAALLRLLCVPPLEAAPPAPRLCCVPAAVSVPRAFACRSAACVSACVCCLCCRPACRRAFSLPPSCVPRAAFCVSCRVRAAASAPLFCLHSFLPCLLSASAFSACLLSCCLPAALLPAVLLLPCRVPLPLYVSAILQRRAACLLCRFFCLLPRFCAAFGIFVPSRRFAAFVGLFLRLCLPCLRRRFSACLRASFRGLPPASLLRCVSVPAAAFVSLRLIPAAAAFACAASPPAAAPACCSAPRLRLH